MTIVVTKSDVARGVVVLDTELGVMIVMLAIAGNRVVV